MGDTDEVKRLLQDIMGEVAVLTNDEMFKEIYGFRLRDYITKREEFATAIEHTADHVEKVLHDTGIAKTTAGATAIVSGAAALGGLLLAPFTAGASLVLTVGGITGGVASSATSLTAQIVKDSNLQQDDKKLKDALAAFEKQEKVTTEIFGSLNDDLEKMREFLKDPTAMEYIQKYGKEVEKIGYNIVYKGYAVVAAVRSIRFARSVASFIQADFYAMAGVAKGMATPGIGGAWIFGRALVAAGSTTAKVLSGVFGAVGMVFGTLDLIGGINDINGSESANKYREFAEDYKKNTEAIKQGIEHLKKGIRE